MEIHILNSYSSLSVMKSLKFVNDNLGYCLVSFTVPILDPQSSRSLLAEFIFSVLVLQLDFRFEQLALVILNLDKLSFDLKVLFLSQECIQSKSKCEIKSMFIQVQRLQSQAQNPSIHAWNGHLCISIWFQVSVCTRTRDMTPDKHGRMDVTTIASVMMDSAATTNVSTSEFPRPSLFSLNHKLCILECLYPYYMSFYCYNHPQFNLTGLLIQKRAKSVIAFYFYIYTT